MKTHLSLCLFIVTLFVGFGCQRGDEFLHHIVDVQPEVFHFTHKLKELQGETRVDILWVIDNSGSMGQHQQNVITNSNLFMQEFTKKQKVLDWKMGLVSTDIRENPYVGFDPGNFLDRKTADPVAVFSQAVNRLGTSGDATERPFAATQRVLMNYPSWTRKGAILALIHLTDAEEQSQIPARDFANFLIQIKGSVNQLVYYGVLGPTDWGCPPSDSNWSYPGTPYEDLSKIIKGKNYILCSPNFGANLADIGKDLVKRVQSPHIGLAMRPLIETIRVTWKGRELKGGPRENGGLWQYDFDLNAIVFHNLDFAPDENEEVIIHFEEAVTARTNR